MRWPCRVVLIARDAATIDAVHAALDASPDTYELSVLDSLHAYGPSLRTSVPDVAVIDLDLSGTRADLGRLDPAVTTACPLVYLCTPTDAGVLPAPAAGPVLDKSPVGYSRLAHTIATERQRPAVAAPAASDTGVPADPSAVASGERESEARDRSIFNHTPLPIWEEDFSEIRRFLDAQQALGVSDWPAYFAARPEAAEHCARLVRVLDVNRASLEFFGAADADELRPHLPLHLMDPDSRVFVAELCALAAGLTHFESEATVRDLRGRVRTLLVSLSVVPGHERTLRRVIVSGFDLTERKQAELSLERSRQWMRLHLQHTPLAVIEWDERWAVREWNPAAEAMFGYTRDEAIGREFSFIVPEAERPGVYETVMRVMGHTGGTRSTNENLRRDGRIITCEWFNTALVGPEGKIIGAASLVQDVTERRELEQQLRQAQKLEAVGQLAGGVAHDFNNILSAMMMNIELLSDRDDLAKDIRWGLSELNRLSERAADLTRQLLMFSRRSVLQVQTLDLNRVVNDLSKMLRRLLGEHIDLVFTPEADLPTVVADRGMVEQVVTNLCVNARDAMSKGGRLSVRTSAVEIGHARARQHPDARVGQFVCVTVADTGCGMEPHVLQRAFEPFFTTKPEGKGTGLGLATVFGIAKQHHGWVEADSVVGQGSVFQVFLPVDDNSAATGREEARARAAGGHETILFIEDEDAVRHITAQVLMRSGYRVVQARDAREALSLWAAANGSVDLILSDMVLPGGISGIELIRMLRAERPQIRAILSSGYSTEFAGTVGPTDRDIVLLPKPVTPAALLVAVRASLGPPSADADQHRDPR